MLQGHLSRSLFASRWTNWFLQITAGTRVSKRAYTPRAHLPGMYTHVGTQWGPVPHPNWGETHINGGGGGALLLAMALDAKMKSQNDAHKQAVSGHDGFGVLKDGGFGGGIQGRARGPQYYGLHAVIVPSPCQVTY